MLSAVIITQILLFAYFVLISYVNLYPFNNIAHTYSDVHYTDRTLGMIFIGLAPFGFLFSIPLLMLFGTVLMTLFLVNGIVTWWVPYFGKPTVAWAQTYQQIHKPTLVFLPGKEAKPAPNAEHVILYGLALTATTLSIVYLAGSWPLF